MFSSTTDSSSEVSSWVVTSSLGIPIESEAINSATSSSGVCATVGTSVSFVIISPSTSFPPSVDLISIRKPVSFAPRRTFCPPRPIASESWSGVTSTVAWRSSLFTRTLRTFAGDSASEINFSISADHSMTSIFSPPSSEITVATRMPRCPTQDPTGSTCASFECTAIFVREPASRAISLSSTTPVETSGASTANNARTKFGCARERRRLMPRGDSSTE